MSYSGNRCKSGSNGQKQLQRAAASRAALNAPSVSYSNYSKWLGLRGREEKSVIYKLFYTCPPWQIPLGERVNGSRKGAGSPRRLRALSPSLPPSFPPSAAAAAVAGAHDKPGESPGNDSGFAAATATPLRSTLTSPSGAAHLQAEASLAECVRAGESRPLPSPQSPCPRGGSAGRGAGRSVLRPERGDAPSRAMRFSYIVRTGVLI